LVISIENRWLVYTKKMISLKSRDSDQLCMSLVTARVTKQKIVATFFFFLISPNSGSSTLAAPKREAFALTPHTYSDLDITISRYRCVILSIIDSFASNSILIYKAV
jgi:hypothetical protein